MYEAEIKTIDEAGKTHTETYKNISIEEIRKLLENNCEGIITAVDFHRAEQEDQ